MNSNDIERGYDFALSQIAPTFACLDDTHVAICALSTEQRIDRVLNMTKTHISLAYKAGIAQCVDHLWKRHQSENRLRVAIPGCGRQVCKQCNVPLPFDDEAQKEHMDCHFRIKMLLAFLCKELDFTTKPITKILLIKQPTVRKINSLHQMLKMDVKQSTRERILTELYPDQKSKQKLATSWGVLNKNTTLEISRGWMMPAKKWTSLSISNVPADVIQYGNMQLSNGVGFWKYVFTSAYLNKQPFVVPPHWKPWIFGLRDDVMIGIADENKKEQQKTSMRKDRGSKEFMRALAQNTRQILVRAEDQYDDRLCALCGGGFKIVLSGDPADTFNEDFVFLDAVAHPFKKTAIAGGILHQNCYLQVAESYQKKPTKANLSSTKKRLEQV